MSNFLNKDRCKMTDKYERLRDLQEIALERFISKNNYNWKEWLTIEEFKEVEEIEKGGVK